MGTGTSTSPTLHALTNNDMRPQLDVVNRGTSILLPAGTSPGSDTHEVHRVAARKHNLRADHHGPNGLSTVADLTACGLPVGVNDS
jgi:hypothetical protein